jgi:hypothetical protein
MSAFHWLHLSDMHVGIDSWADAHQSLADDLEKVCAVAGPLDLVLLTGDLTHTGTEEEFKRLDGVLHRLLDHLRTLGNCPQLLMVPGNHDLRRPPPLDPACLALTRETPTALRDLWTASAYYPLIERAFAPFQQFQQRWRDPNLDFGALPGDFACTYEKSGARLGILGLNTAFLQLTDDDYHGRLVIDRHQLRRLTGDDPAAWAAACNAIVLMTHHGPSWLSPAARELLHQELSRMKRPVVHVFGHRHASGELHAFPRWQFWQGSALFGLQTLADRTTGRRQGYAAGRLTVVGPDPELRIWPRRPVLIPGTGWHFGPDTDYRLAEDIAHVEEPGARKPDPPLSEPQRWRPAVHQIRITSDPWTRAVLTSHLWDDIPAGGTAEAWRTGVHSIVTACRAVWDLAQSALADPWRDEDLPPRVLRMLELLAADSAPTLDLSPCERVLAMVAPFVREAAFAAGALWMAEADPLSLAPGGPSHGGRVALEREHSARAPFVRKANRLRDQGRDDDYRAVALWMMHGSLVREPALWQTTPDGPSLDTIIAAIDTAALLGSTPKEVFHWERLRELARCTFADPERIFRDDHANRLRDRERFDDDFLRSKLLGSLLCIASWMAMDIRHLPALLVDHLGLTDPLTPADVAKALCSMGWRHEPPRGHVLMALCTHPAIDHALRAGVERAETTLAKIRDHIAGDPILSPLNAMTPRLKADGIQPSLDASGHPPYRLPLLRFELAHDEVKELFMGERLYGEPGLAIRELYQNALDACRYRKAREIYLRQTKQRMGNTAPWSGLIQFRQAFDDGRPYIECEDNGVGMGLSELESCFARAGKRFVDMPEFLEEQTEWLRVEPPIRLYPSSQFGVGVLSYFMLADEIEVETCRFQRNGTMGPRILVRIAGSGSLFRIKLLPYKPGQIAGTRVRLYLNQPDSEAQDDSLPISCSAHLQRVLWLAEFLTTCSEAGENKRIWEPGVLAPPEQFNRSWREQPLSKPHRIAEDVWCWRDSSVVLSDGILVEEAGLDIPSLIVNCRGHHRAPLTVNRKNTLHFDDAWILAALASSEQQILSWPDLSINFLWWLEGELETTARSLVAQLEKSDRIVQLESDDHSIYSRLAVSFSKIGCFRADGDLLAWAESLDHETADVSWGDQPHISSQIPAGYAYHRLSIWQAVGAATSRMPPEPPPSSASESTFSPRIGDTSILFAYANAQEPSPQPVLFAEVAAKCGYNVRFVYERLREFERFGVSVPQLPDASLDSLDFVISDADRRLLGATRWASHQPASPLEILHIAVTVNESPESVLQRFEKFAILGITPQKIPLETLKELLPHLSRYHGLFSPDWDQNLLVGGLLSHAGIIHGAHRAGFSVGATYDIFRHFDGLGLRLPHMNHLLIQDRVPSAQDMEILKRLGSCPTCTGSAFALCQRSTSSLGDAHRLGYLAGSWTPPCEELEAAQFHFDEVDVKLLSSNLDGEAPFLTNDEVSRKHVQHASETFGISEDAIRARILRMAPLGVTCERDRTLSDHAAEEA